MSEFLRYVKEHGIDLSALSISDVGLRREEAITALQLLEVEETAALGGDVLIECKGEIRHAYANWSVQREDGETDSEFVRRSVMKARTYICSYPQSKSSDETVLFIIVR